MDFEFECPYMVIPIIRMHEYDKCFLINKIIAIENVSHFIIDISHSSEMFLILQL